MCWRSSCTCVHANVSCWDPTRWRWAWPARSRASGVAAALQLSAAATSCFSISLPLQQQSGAALVSSWFPEKRCVGGASAGGGAGGSGEPTPVGGQEVGLWQLQTNADPSRWSRSTLRLELHLHPQGQSSEERLRLTEEEAWRSAARTAIGKLVSDWLRTPIPAEISPAP